MSEEKGKKLNILLLSSTFYPIVGGAETYAFELASGLVQNGHKVLVVTDKISKNIDRNQFFSEYIKDFKINIYRTKRYINSMNARDKVKWEQMYFSLLDELKTVCEENTFDIIHANSQETSIVGTMLSFHLQIPLVVTFHEMYPEKENFGYGRCKFTYNTLPISYIIAGSEYYENKAKQFMENKDRVVRIYHGVDTSRFSVNADKSYIKKKYNLSEEIIITCLSRFKERKGLVELVKAFKIVSDKFVGDRDIKLILGGSCNSASIGYLYILKRLIAELGLEDKVILDETLFYNEVSCILAGADIVIQPSYEEGLGLTVLEALSSCKPIIGTQVSGISEIITNEVDGLLVRPRDEKELADAILRLLYDEKLAKRLAEEGRRTVCKKFSKKLMIAKTESLYYRTLA